MVKSSHVFELGQGILWLKTGRMRMVTLLDVEECKLFPNMADGFVAV